MVADRDVFVVGEEGLVGAEELADAGGVVDGGVEVGVVRYVDWLLEGRADDGVKGGFSLLTMLGTGIGVKEGGEFFAEESPSSLPLRHQEIERRGLAGGGQGWREQTGGGAGVKIEKVGADGNTEVLLIFDCEGAVGKMSQGEVRGGVVCVGEPALCGVGGLVGHGA